MYKTQTYARFLENLRGRLDRQKKRTCPGKRMVTLMMMIMDITLGIYLVKKRIHRAYSILGLIKRNFRYLYLTEEALVTLFKSLVRCHLKNANSV